MNNRYGVSLTGREQEVALVAADGRSSRAIADELFVSVRTVESHLAAIYRKLQVSSRPELVAKLATLDITPQLGPRAAPLVGTGFSSTAGLVPVPHFVGRTAELEVINAAIASASNGSHRIVLVSGESGVGKSSLLADAVNRRRPGGSRVLLGRCTDGLGTPFGPIIEAVRPVLELHPGPLAELTGSAGGVLAGMLPELADDLPHLRDDVPAAVRPRLVVEVLLNVLRSVSGDQPLVVIVEDLHWVDRATVSFLQKLITSGRPGAIALLASFRDTSLDGAHPLTAFLADIWREEEVDRIALRGLGVDDARDLARHIVGTDVAEDLVGRAHRSSGGNAFYLDQLLRHPECAPEDSALPNPLRSVVVDRVRRMRNVELGPLDVAAIIGLEFELTMVEAAVGLAGIPTDRPVIDSIERADRAGLVQPAEDSPDGYRFVHDVVRRAMLEQLNPARRARIHAAVGRAMVDGQGVDGIHLAAAVEHLSQSPLVADRLQAGALAARVVRDVAGVAPDDSVDVAISALQCLPAGPGGDRVRLEVLIALAEVHYLRMDHEPHREAVMEAVAVARRLGDPVALARALERFRLIPRAGGTDDEVLALVEEAVAGIGSDQVALRARLNSYAAYHRSIGGQGAATADDARQAVGDARASADLPTLAMALHNLLAILMGSPDVDSQVALVAELSSSAPHPMPALDDVDHARLCGTVHLQLGDRAGFDADHIAIRDQAIRTKSTFLGSVDTMWTALAQMLDGQVEAAEATNDRLLAQAIGEPTVLLGWFAQLCWIRAEQDRLDEVLALVEQTLLDHGDLPAVRAVAAWVFAEHGDHPRATEVLDPLVGAGFTTIVDGWLLPGTLGFLTAVLGRWGDLDDCRLLLDRLDPFRGQALVLGSGTIVLGAADRYIGQIHFRLGNSAASEASMIAAADLERRLGAPLLEAHTLLTQAELLSSPGSRSASPTMVAALDEIESLATGHDDWAAVHRRIRLLRP